MIHIHSISSIIADVRNLLENEFPQKIRTLITTHAPESLRDVLIARTQTLLTSCLERGNDLLSIFQPRLAELERIINLYETAIHEP